jgi:hypothetical protein
MTVIGIDPGAGALKIYGPGGGVQAPAILAVDEGHTLARMVGLAQRKPPLRVRTENGAFFVGAGAHNGAGRSARTWTTTASPARLSCAQCWRRG